jgi:hypothetical protein
VGPVKEAPNILQRHPEVRWLASAVVAAALIALVASSVSGAFRTDLSLRATGPQEVITQVRAGRTTGYSGTVNARVQLGLPSRLAGAVAAELPVGGALLAGSHTFGYWYGGEQRQRVAIPGPNDEQDIFRTGDTVMVWDTARRTLERHVLDGTSAAIPLVDGPAALTPPELADRILDFGSSASSTTLRSGDRIAGRPTYELVIEPNTTRSLIDSVHIQIDGIEAVPLGVQIYARGWTSPVVDVAFQTITFGAPQDRNFSFVPPPDARVVNGGLVDLDGVRTINSGWLEVLSYRTTPELAATVDTLFGAGMHRVKGSWGSGRLYSAGPVSVLVTSKGRLLVGAVQPRVLYLAATH